MLAAISRTLKAGYNYSYPPRCSRARTKFRRRESRRVWYDIQPHSAPALCLQWGCGHVGSVPAVPWIISDYTRERLRGTNSQATYFSVTRFQAEDEIARRFAPRLAASFGGAIAITTTSARMNLKAEASVSQLSGELPLVITSIHRAGPSTGMRTTRAGRPAANRCTDGNGESPIPIIAAFDARRLLRLPS